MPSKKAKRSYSKRAKKTLYMVVCKTTAETLYTFSKRKNALTYAEKFGARVVRYVRAKG